MSFSSHVKRIEGGFVGVSPNSLLLFENNKYYNSTKSAEITSESNLSKEGTSGWKDWSQCLGKKPGSNWMVITSPLLE